jgi:hypothetical protein
VQLKILGIRGSQETLDLPLGCEESRTASLLWLASSEIYDRIVAVATSGQVCQGEMLVARTLSPRASRTLAGA